MATSVLAQGHPAPHVLNVALDRFDKFDDAHALWKVFTRCKHAIDDGHRLENMSWRLWNRRMSASSTASFDGSDLSGFESDSSSASSALSASASASSGHLPHGPITLTQPPQAPHHKQIASSQPTHGIVYRPTLEPRSHSQPTLPILHAGRFIRDILPFKFSPTSSPSAVSLRSCTTSPYPAGSKLPVATVVLPSTPPSASSKGAPAVIVVNPTPHPTPPATPRVPDELPTRTQATVSCLPNQAITSPPSLRVPSPALPMIPPNPAPMASEGVDTARPTKLFYLSQATPQQSPDSTSSGTGTTTTTSGTRDLHAPSDVPARLRDGSIASSGPHAAGPSTSRSRSPGDDSLVVGSATSARSRGSAGSAVRRGGKTKDLRHAVGGSRSARAAFTPRSTLQNRAAARAATLPAGKAAGAVHGLASGAALARTDNALTSRDLAPAATLPYTDPSRQLTSAAAARDAAVPVAGSRSNVPITPTQAPTPRTTASLEGIQPVASASGSGIARAPEVHWTSNLAQAQPPLPPQQQRTSTLFTTLLKPTRNKVQLESSEDDSSEQEEEEWTEEDESDRDERPPARGRTAATRSAGREPSVVNEAAQELERQVELVKKLPHRSWSNLDRLQPKSGLLTHIFRPDLVRSGLPHHSMSSVELSGMGGRGNAMPPMRRGAALQPLTQAVTAQPTLSAHQPPPQRRSIVPPTSPQQQLPRTGYQPRARPVDEDIETDSDDDPDDAVHVSQSMAQQRLLELANRHQHQRRTSPLQQQLETAAAAPSLFPSPSPPQPPFPPAEPIPVMINHAMLPIPLPAVSPRTTRRNMMASEMSESLRHNLLRERQVAKRSLGVQRNTSAQDLPMVNERGQPLTEREIARHAAIQRNKSFQGPFMPGGL